MSSDYESYSGVKVAEFGLDAIEARMALEIFKALETPSMRDIRDDKKMGVGR